MHQSLVGHVPVALTAARGATIVAATTAAGHLTWTLLSGLLSLVAVIRVLRQPAENWSHRNWSKLAWVLAIGYLAPPLGGYPMPIGAIAAIWRTRRQPNPPPAPGQPPMAEGSSDWPWPWDAQ
jgi:hypothetical protein